MLLNLNQSVPKVSFVDNCIEHFYDETHDTIMIDKDVFDKTLSLTLGLMESTCHVDRLVYKDASMTLHDSFSNKYTKRSIEHLMESVLAATILTKGRGELNQVRKQTLEEMFVFYVDEFEYCFNKLFNPDKDINWARVHNMSKFFIFPKDVSKLVDSFTDVWRSTRAEFGEGGKYAATA